MKREIMYQMTCTVFHPQQDDPESKRPVFKFKGQPSQRTLDFMFHHARRALQRYKAETAESVKPQLKDTDVKQRSEQEVEDGN